MEAHRNHGKATHANQEYTFLNFRQFGCMLYARPSMKARSAQYTCVLNFMEYLVKSCAVLSITPV